MKFPVFAFVVVYILEDYGTFQGRPIDKTTQILVFNYQSVVFFSMYNIRAADVEIQKPIERARLFRQFALELVNAAIPPLLENREIMEHGCECIPIMEEDEMVNSIDLFLATMSIGKDYYGDLHILRLAPDLSEIVLSKRALMKNVQKILVVFQSPARRFRDDTVDKVLRSYVLRRKEGSPAAGNSRYDESLKLAIKCFKSMISLYHEDNERYYSQLKEGFEIVGDLIRDDDEVSEDDFRWNELNMIIEEIKGLHLTTADSDYVEQEIEEFLEKLNENNENNQVDSDTD